MKIAYVTLYDPADVLNWSGTGTHIQKALKEQGCEVEFLGPLPQYSRLRKHLLKVKGVWYNRLLRGRLGSFSSERDLKIAQFYAEAVVERLKGKHYDVIVSPGCIPVAFVRTHVPIVIWADATFDSLVTTYPGYMKMTSEFYRDGERLEREALGRAELCVFSSDWAAQSAIRHYGIEERKVKVIPFGANIDDDTREDIEAAIAGRNKEKVRLLFIGYEFERKGGPKLFEVLQELCRLVPAELHIIGCTPQVPEALLPHVQVYGCISKRTDEGRQKLTKAFLSSHWVVLLSRAECYGLVLAEANRYGVPCISNRVGGIPTIIKDEYNGKLFPVNAAPIDIAKYIAGMSLDRERYSRMAIAGYQEYKSRLNWRAAGNTFTSCVRELVSGPERGCRCNQQDGPIHSKDRTVFPVAETLPE